MNRKQRRAARKADNQATPTRAAQPQSWTELLAQASDRQRQGDREGAIKLYRRALTLNPDHAQLHNQIGCLLLEQGKRTEASRHFRQALRLTPELFESYGDLLSLLQQLNPALAPVRTKAIAARPQLVPLSELLDTASRAALARDELLREVLHSTPVRDVGLEALFTCLRAGALDAAGEHAALDGDQLLLGCAVARQCFLNEYIFAVTDAEQAKLENLKHAVASALAAGHPPPIRALVVLASYLPLGLLSNAAVLLQQHWPAAVNDLISQQLREPGLEHELRKTIPQLTPIEQNVSRRVRQQYEENPYPRWVLAPSQPEPESIDDYLGRTFPGVPLRPLDASRGLDILVAGCGTGAHALVTAQRFAGSRVLAIDLSLASLAYAKRKAQQIGFHQIEFAQADILELGSLDRTFDMIDASGVLHHLADPMHGWRILLSRLRPGGVMHVGLYSELARRDVVAAREFIAARGYPPTVEGIRRCRQDLLQTPLKSLARAYDFFSVSECRDLLFHVEEHRLTIPELEAFIAGERLSFIGFDLVPELRRRYTTHFPADRSLTNLASWHQFETANPDTFGGMYQFWVQKA